MQSVPFDQDVIQRVCALLQKAGMLSTTGNFRLMDEGICQPILSDGSTRTFVRLSLPDQPSCMVILPAQTSRPELDESRAAWFLGNHLRNKGIPVPELYGWDSERGILICEDLGNIRLQDVLGGDGCAAGLSGCQTGPWVYLKEAVAGLAEMQVRGAAGFETDWCWDTPRYDVALMVDRESKYFLDAFWNAYLGKRHLPGVEEECHHLALMAAQAPADFFLHRDFQSRNIMVKDGHTRFIDYQGGRLGPLGYDLSSLLIDPYTALSRETEKEMIEHYLRKLQSLSEVNEKEFYRHYDLLAVQRNMQIIGAFSFLAQVRGKSFFRQFIKPAVMGLGERLHDPLFSDYKILRSMVWEAADAMRAA